MAKLTKKQRSAVREIDKLSEERKRDQLFGYGSIALMAIVIIAYNALTYSMGIIDPNNSVLRAMLYITAMVLAGVSGIKLMQSSRKKNKIDGYRQSTGISRETLDAWKKGELE